MRFPKVCTQSIQEMNAEARWKECGDFFAQVALMDKRVYISDLAASCSLEMINVSCVCGKQALSPRFTPAARRIAGVFIPTN